MPLNLTRSLLVVLIPGGVMLAPWLLWLVSQEKDTAQLYADYPQLVWAALFAASTVVGSFVETANSHIEVIWDRRRESALEVSANWYDYLARPCSSEPVGYGYLSRMYTTMYFELAMSWAVLVGGSGVVALLASSDTPHYLTLVAVVVVNLLLSLVMLRSAYDSHGVLCETRRQMNLRLEKIIPIRPIQSG